MKKKKKKHRSYGASCTSFTKEISHVVSGLACNYMEEALCWLPLVWSTGLLSDSEEFQPTKS